MRTREDKIENSRDCERMAARGNMPIPRITFRSRNAAPKVVGTFRSPSPFLIQLRGFISFPTEIPSRPAENKNEAYLEARNDAGPVNNVMYCEPIHPNIAALIADRIRENLSKMLD